MKLIFVNMKRIITSLIIAGTLFTVNVSGNVKQPPPHSHMLVKKPKPVIDILCDIEIEIPGLVCASCAIGVKKNLAKIFFVPPNKIKFDTKKQVVCISLFEKLDSTDTKTFLLQYQDKIKKAVKDAGYKVKKIVVKKSAVV